MPSSLTPRKRRRPRAGRQRRLAFSLGLFGIGGFVLHGMLPWSRPAAEAGRPVKAQMKVQRVQAETGEEERELPDSPERMAQLNSELRRMVAEAPARSAAVYVQDLLTGETAGVNEDRYFLAASLIKLPVMAAAYELWEKRPELKTNSARWSLEQMIVVSDNGSTDRLIDMVGGPEVVTRFCARRGWPTLKVRHAILNHRGRRGLNQCTAREVVELLASLDRRELVSAEADEEMWKVLCRQQKVARIPAGLPKLAGLEVGNKTGTLGNALHDAGIVHTSNARYALCVLLSGQRSEYQGNQFCRRVSRAVFDALHGPTAPAPAVTTGDLVQTR